jgi:hypothetical protein
MLTIFENLHNIKKTTSEKYVFETYISLLFKLARCNGLKI